MWQLIAPFTRNPTNHLGDLFQNLLELQGFDRSTELYVRQDDIPSTAQRNDVFQCKTLILVSSWRGKWSSQRVRPGYPFRLRSYASKRDGDVNVRSCTIWQAAMATIAIPLEMDAVKIDDAEFFSAAIAGFSNPTKEALDEATRIWNLDALQTVINIGSGGWGKNLLNDGLRTSWFPVLDLIQFQSYVTTGSERVAEEMDREARVGSFDYTRFSVASDLEVRRSEWSETARQMILSATKSYLMSPEVHSSILKCRGDLLATYNNLRVTIETRAAGLSGIAKPPPHLIRSENTLGGNTDQEVQAHVHSDDNKLKQSANEIHIRSLSRESNEVTIDSKAVLFDADSDNASEKE